jgi:tetratricopeptide (TPR) repeat protein
MNFIMIFVRPYLRLLEGGIFQNILPIAFTLISFSQAYRGLPVARSLWQNWVALKPNPLTAVKKRLADDASFFVAVPIGVLIHEAGHALAVLLFGGQVLEFGFFFFWGYVLPAGEFTATQNWIIAAAGTWGNLLFALAVWLAWRRSSSDFLHYLMLRTVRFQIFFALIYYPIFTVLLQLGDWRTIYNFELTPVLSGTTAVLHAMAVIVHVIADRRGAYQLLAFEDEAEAEAVRELKAQITANPDDLDQQARYLNLLANGGAVNEAQRHLAQLLKTHPNWALGYLLQAILSNRNRQRPSKTVTQAAEKALALGLDKPVERGMAHQIIGLYALHTERYAEARQSLEAAIREMDRERDEHGRVPPSRLINQSRLYTLRAQTYRRQNNYSAARADMEMAIKLAEQAQQPELAESYRTELAQTIQPHL